MGSLACPCEPQVTKIAYFALFQLLWHDVGPDFTPFNQVVPMFRMPTHCPCACAFVIAIADLLGREW